MKKSVCDEGGIAGAFASDQHSWSDVSLVLCSRSLRTNGSFCRGKLDALTAVVVVAMEQRLPW
jgi:hypothetical protein